MFNSYFVRIFVQILKIMITATISDFRKDIKQYFSKVTENFETLIINRGKNSGVVVISLTEYNSLLTTQHEMSSEINKKDWILQLKNLKVEIRLVKNL